MRPGLIKRASQLMQYLQQACGSSQQSRTWQLPNKQRPTLPGSAAIAGPTHHQAPYQSKGGMALNLTMRCLQSGDLTMPTGVSPRSIDPEQPNIDCFVDNPACGAGQKFHAWPCRQGSNMTMLPAVVPASNATPRAAAMNGAAVLSCSTVMSCCHCFPKPAGLSEMWFGNLGVGLPEQLTGMLMLLCPDLRPSPLHRSRCSREAHEPSAQSKSHFATASPHGSRKACLSASATVSHGRV